MLTYLLWYYPTKNYSYLTYSYQAALKKNQAVHCFITVPTIFIQDDVTSGLSVCRRAVYSTQWVYTLQRTHVDNNNNGRLNIAANAGWQKKIQSSMMLPCTQSPCDRQLMRVFDACWSTGPNLYVFRRFTTMNQDVCSCVFSKTMNSEQCSRFSMRFWRSNFVLRAIDNAEPYDAFQTWRRLNMGNYQINLSILFTPCLCIIAAELLWVITLQEPEHQLLM